MIFIIFIVLGAVGTMGTLWLSSRTRWYIEKPVPAGQEWFAMSPDRIESIVGMKIRETWRDLLKKILIWMIGQYRSISKKITVKQVLKQKVRAFLYEHTPNGVRNPSKMWNHLKDTNNQPLIAPEEITSSEPSEQ